MPMTKVVRRIITHPHWEHKAEDVAAMFSHLPVEVLVTENFSATKMGFDGFGPDEWEAIRRAEWLEDLDLIFLHKGQR